VTLNLGLSRRVNHTIKSSSVLVVFQGPVFFPRHSSSPALSAAAGGSPEVRRYRRFRRLELLHGMSCIGPPSLKFGFHGVAAHLTRSACAIPTFAHKHRQVCSLSWVSSCGGPPPGSRVACPFQEARSSTR
jgi:hypothetical protein